MDDVIKEILQEGGCNKRKAELIETDIKKMEERLENKPAAQAADAYPSR